MVLEAPDRKRGFKKERMLRVILQNPDGEMSRYRVAQNTKASEPWVHEYFDRLEDKGIIEGTRVRDFERIFKEWLEVRIEPARFQVSFQEPLKLLESIDLDYALTTYQAEQLFSGHLFPKKTEFYIQPKEREEWKNFIEEKGLIGGGNTTILLTDPHVFYERRKNEGLNTVCLPQLIIDLLAEGGPAIEAAEMLAEKHYNSNISFSQEI